MENKVKDNREEQRIEREAEKWVKEFYNVSNYQPVLKEVRKESYITGATKEAERCKPLVEALENTLAVISFYDCPDDIDHAALRKVVTKALQDYNKK